MKLIPPLILLASTISQLAIAVDPDPAQLASITTNELSESANENESQAQLRQAIEQSLKYVTDNYAVSQQNKSDIASHKTAIGGNVTSIATNTSDIADHKTAISKNTSDIAAIKTTVGKNVTSVANNTSDIAAIKTTVGKNVTSVANNTSDIAAIKTTIGENVTSLSNNTSNISDHRRAVSKNTSDIAAIKTTIGKNVTSVANNTGDIAAIKTAIGENVTSLANNTSNITDHKRAVGKNTSDIAAIKTTIGKNTTSLANNTSDIAANKTAINANTDNINSNFAALDNISYNNGTITFGSAGSGPETSRTKTVQLFEPTSTSQSEGVLNQEMLYNRSILTTTVDPWTTATNQQIQNLQWQYHDLSRKVDKQGKAISVNAAFAALPSGYMPDKNFIGIGVGHFKNHTGVALGLTRNFDNGIIVQGRYGASGGTSVVSAAAGISF